MYFGGYDFSNFINDAVVGAGSDSLVNQLSYVAEHISDYEGQEVVVSGMYKGDIETKINQGYVLQSSDGFFIRLDYTSCFNKDREYFDGRAYTVQGVVKYGTYKYKQQYFILCSEYMN